MKPPRNGRQRPIVALVAGLGGLFAIVNPACGQPWATTDAPVPFWNWSALAASADGSRLVVAAAANEFVDSAPIYVSTKAGANWTQTSAPSNNWFSVACSADGTKLVAVASASGPGWARGDGFIYTSPDAGGSWSAASPPSATATCASCSWPD